jgi:hypothetical protein
LSGIRTPISRFELEKTVHALNRAVTVLGIPVLSIYNISLPLILLSGPFIDTVVSFNLFEW